MVGKLRHFIKVFKLKKKPKNFQISQKNRT